MPAKISREMLPLDRMAVTVLQRRAFRIPCMARCTCLDSTHACLRHQLGGGGRASWMAIGDPSEGCRQLMGGSGRDVGLGPWCCSWFGGRSRAVSDLCFCSRTKGLCVSALLVAIGAGVRDVRGRDNATMAGSSRPGFGLHCRPVSLIIMVTTLSSYDGRVVTYQYAAFEYSVGAASSDWRDARGPKPSESPPRAP